MITIDEVNEIMRNLIFINEELTLSEKKVATMSLIPMSNEQVALIQSEAAYGKDIEKLREIHNDKILKCHLISALDEYIPKQFYIDDDDKRYRFLSIISDIFNEVKLQVIAKTDPSEVQDISKDTNNPYTNNDISKKLMSIMEDELEKSPISAADKEIMTDRIHSNIGGNPELVKCVLDMCPFSLENLDQKYATDASVLEIIEIMYKSDHPDDDPKYAKMFAEIYNLGLKELLRWHLTEKQKKNK